jgi:hypothetical protein
MPEFKNVTIVKQANSYFDGRVTSRTIKFENGSTKTLGFMLPGDYRFNTADKELMEMLVGEVEVLLPGSQEWQKLSGGATFEVPANSAFDIRVLSPTDYCCSFIS